MADQLADGAVSDGLLPDGPVADGSIKDIDKGSGEELTPEEKAEAKRKYKNRRGRERWQRRRKEQKERERLGLADGSPSTDLRAIASAANDRRGTDAEASTALVSSPRSESPDSRAAANMLREFSQLGKVEEGKLKQCLNQLRSFSFLPNGNTLFRREIVELINEIVDLSRGGPLGKKEYCQRLAASQTQIEAQNVWAETPNSLTKILQTFAEGRENDTFVIFENAKFLRGKRITLKQLSEISHIVLVHLYCHLTQQLTDLIPQIQLGVVTPSVYQKATSICLDLGLLVGSYLTGNLSEFATNRVDSEPYEFSRKLMSTIVECVEITPSQSLRLWHLWDTNLAKLKRLYAEKIVLEDRLNSAILQTQGWDADYVEACRHMQTLKANQLAICIHGLLLDCKAVYEILTPYQTAFLLCAQLPPEGAKEIFSCKLDPIGSMTVLFQRSLFPNSPSRGVI